MEEKYSSHALSILNEDYNATGPLEIANNITSALVDNVQYESYLTRFDAIYIYSGLFFFILQTVDTYRAVVVGRRWLPLDMNLKILS